MKNIKLGSLALLFLAASISCKWINTAGSTDTAKGPPIDFTTPGKGLDVKVQLDKKQTASGKITKAGGGVSLTAADGSRFTLEVPANAVETDTTITMTAVKSIDERHSTIIRRRRFSLSHPVYFLRKWRL